MLGKKKRRIWLPLAVLLTGTVVAALDARLAVRHYRLETARVSAPVRIALLTDLHSCDYGEGQAGLLEAVAAGCDTFVTADVRYNQFWDAHDLGLNLIDAGHFYTENPVTRVLADTLKNAFPDISVKISETHTDCMKYA